MSLRDFMQQLQEEDEQVVYSKPAEEHIQIIPPIKADNKINTESIKILPPKEDVPQVVRFKLKSPIEAKVEINSSINANKLNVTIPPKKDIAESVKLNRPIIKDETKLESYKNNVTPQKESLSEDNIEQLFLQSETSECKRDRWMFYYKKAQESKKSTAVVQKMKKGRFRVKDDAEIVLEPKDDEGVLKLPPDVDLLPDFITYKKTVGQILQQKWLKK